MSTVEQGRYAFSSSCKKHYLLPIFEKNYEIHNDTETLKADRWL